MPLVRLSSKQTLEALEDGAAWIVVGMAAVTVVMIVVGMFETLTLVVEVGVAVIRERVPSAVVVSFVSVGETDGGSGVVRS